MKNALGSLIVSGIACVLVASALVMAQVPNAGITAGTITVTKKLDDKQAKREAPRAVIVPGRPRPDLAPEKKIAPPPVNLGNLVQQYMQQARPLVRAELIFVRKVCELDLPQFRRIHQETEVAFKDAMTKFVEAQRAKGVGTGQNKKFRPVPLTRWRSCVDGLASVMRKDLTPEQFARYQAELEKRDAFQKQSGVRYLVEALDRDLYLSDDQRRRLIESLSSHWDQSWRAGLEFRLLGNQFYPAGIDPYVTPLLESTRKRCGKGAKSRGDRGLFGLLGGFMNNDALEPELKEKRLP